MKDQLAIEAVAPVNAPNWENRTIFTGDNLEVLRRMNTGSVDLVYLDPPFNSNRNYSAPIGSLDAVAKFKDAWTLDDIDELDHEQLRDQHPALHDVILAARLAGGDSTMSYLLMMAARLIELQRVLKPTASIYLHCDPTASHYLKMVMDVVFGRDNFRNEVIWGYRTQGVGKKYWPKKHDVLLFYSKGESWTFYPQMERQYYEKAFRHTLIDDKGRHYVDTYRRSVWDHDETRPVISQGKERTGYPTQKPTALLERIIKASSNEGDVVLDPFCGCATTAIAAEKLGRQWVGIDLSPLAYQLVKQRLGSQLDLPDLEPVERTGKHLERTDFGKLPPYKSHKPALYGEQAGDCNGCGVHFPLVNFDVDHIVPRSKGGSDHKSNLQLLCGNCNSRKGAGSMSDLMVKLLKERGVR